MTTIIVLGTGFEVSPDGAAAPTHHWQPFIDSDASIVGMVCTRLSDGKKTYIYMNPSDTFEGDPDVFIYNGVQANPCYDPTECFITPNFDEPYLDELTLQPRKEAS